MVSYIVVGAGSAGNVVARRLLDAGHTVAVLEAGGQDTNPIIANVAAAGGLWRGPEDWNYVTTEQEGCHGRRLNLPRGKVMGGSHALNATIWVRGPREDYDTWNYLGCPGWGYDDVLPVFKAIENYSGGDSDSRGGEGFLDVTSEFDLNPIQQSILDGAVEWGLELNEDYNSGEVDGVSKMQLNVRDGKRFNTWHAYLKPEMDNPNLRIYTDSHVLRLLLDGNQVTGVQFRHDGEVKTLEADETILCAGALGSPEILLRSGIGPADELAQVGLDPVHDLPGVGKNLHDHLLSPVIFTTHAREVPEPGVAAAETHLFWKSEPDLAVPDTQPINFSLPMYFLDDMSGPDNGFSLVAGLIRPHSRGAVTLSGPGEDDPVNVDLGALKDAADARALAASVRQCREIGRTAALGEWEPEEIYPGPDVSDSDEDLINYVRDTAVTYHHQVGTCAMGLDELAVVDPRTFEVHGLQGIRIADASIMPLITSGNTNAPTIMIAERAAAHLLGKDVVGAA